MFAKMIGAVVATLALSVAPRGLAQSREADDVKINPFTKSYFRVELERNYPEAATQSKMSAGNVEPSFTYLHVVNDSWLMGLGGEMKLFNRNKGDAVAQPSRTLAVYTLSHETMYVIRLSHPNYFLVGPKLLYLLPALTGTPPPQRDTVYQPEVGGALTVQFVRILANGWLLSLSVDRWRGFNTSLLSGLEVGVGLAFTID